MVSGRVVDDTGAGVAGARVEMRSAADAVVAVASSDLAGNFNLTLAAGDYSIRAERQGFYRLQMGSQTFTESATQLTVSLNHLQEYSERVDVTSSRPVIDPQQPS